MLATTLPHVNCAEVLVVSEFAFGARVCDPQQFGVQPGALRLTEPRS
jgi:hypothetical protein